MRDRRVAPLVLVAGVLVMTSIVANGRPSARTAGRARIFGTTSWTVPTLVGTTLYPRDREKTVAIDLGR